jgi:DNA-binding transcriptional MerR regulator
MGWLLSPSGRTDSGCRLYSERDLERLQEILGWRPLGFSLDEVSHDQVSALRTQRELVDAELARLAGLARALDRAIATIEHGNEQQEEMMFDGLDPSQYEDEARERWGRTDAYTDAARLVASYGEAEWRESNAQAQDIERLFAGLKRSGQPADGEPARAAAEQARLHIDRSFYPCSRDRAARRRWRDRNAHGCGRTVPPARTSAATVALHKAFGMCTPTSRRLRPCNAQSRLGPGRQLSRLDDRLNA